MAQSGARAGPQGHFSPVEVTWTVARGRDDGLFAPSDTARPLDPRHSFSVPASIRRACENGDPESRSRTLRPAVPAAVAAATNPTTICSISRPIPMSRTFMTCQKSAATSTRCMPSSASANSARDDDFRFVAWFEPSHYIVELAAPFFERRFADMAWSILTPDRVRALEWAQNRLYAGALSKTRLRPSDRLEDIWRTTTPAFSIRRG